MGVVLALACVLPFITIFLFKRRLLQIRLCVVEIVLLIGFVVAVILVATYGYKDMDITPQGKIHGKKEA